MSTDVQGKLRELSGEFSQLQTEQQTLITALQRFRAQKTENEGVKKEFDQLKDDETIYKLVGPVLLKQDKIEADSTVKGRLDFITKEMERLEKEIDESNKKMDEVKAQIIGLQSSAQTGGAAPVAAQ